MRALCAALVLLAGAPAGAELRAEQIRAGTAAELDVGGPDAIGGVGDWWLSNGLVEAVIDDVSRRHAKSNHGGTLVDLGLAGVEGEDQFARLIPLVNLSQRVSAGYDEVRAEVDAEAGAARIVVSGTGLDVVPAPGWLGSLLDPFVPAPETVAQVRVETVYELRRGEGFLRIATTLVNEGAAPAPVFAFGDLWMRGGRSGRGSMGNWLAPERSRGFAARRTGASLDSARGALGAFTHLALFGSPDFPGPVSYGYASPERAARGLSLYGMMQEHASLALAFVGDPDAEGWSTWRVLRGWWRGLAPGERWRYERRVWVATGGLDASLARELGAAAESGLQATAPLAGRRAIVRVETPSGAQLAHCRPERSALAPDGPEMCWTALPAGDYVAVLRVEHAPEQRRALRVEPGAIARLDFEASPPPAHLVFPDAFADGGPGRVEVRGLGTTPDPVFGDDLLGATLDGAPLPSATASSAILFAGTDADPREVALPAGRYALVATRGLDWEIARTELEVEEGARAEVAPFVLEPLPPLADHVSADLHVHAEASDDSQAPNAERLRRFAAEGVDVLVATDHDHVAHYAPALAALGLGDRVRVVTGVEVTSSTPSHAAPSTLGHHNAWPIPYAPHAHRDGAPESQERSVAALYAELRERYGARVVQLNHPRSADPGDTAGNFFEHLGVGRPFDRESPAAAPEGALGFDAIELMNGSGWAAYRAVRADWLALLRTGLRRTGTANSDSHSPSELIGFPRNYVRVGEGEVERRDPARFDAALRAGASFGTTGPRIVRFTVNGVRSGETARAGDGRLRIAWQVDAASWVPLDEVRLLVDGAVIHRSGERSGELDWNASGARFVHLEAGAPPEVECEAWIAAHAASHPAYTGVLAPGFVSAAFANPVYLAREPDAGPLTARSP